MYNCQYGFFYIAKHTVEQAGWPQFDIGANGNRSYGDSALSSLHNRFQCVGIFVYHIIQKCLLFMTVVSI